MMQPLGICIIRWSLSDYEKLYPIHGWAIIMQFITMQSSWFLVRSILNKTWVCIHGWRFQTRVLRFQGSNVQMSQNIQVSQINSRAPGLFCDLPRLPRYYGQIVKCYLGRRMFGLGDIGLEIYITHIHRWIHSHAYLGIKFQPPTYLGTSPPDQSIQCLNKYIELYPTSPLSTMYPGLHNNLLASKVPTMPITQVSVRHHS